MAYTRSYKTSKGQLRWRAEVRIKGAGKVSKSFLRKTDADEWARKQHEQMQRIGVGMRPEQKYTLNDAIEKYITEHLPTLKHQAANKNMLKWWSKYLGERFLSSITSHEILRLRRDLEKERVSKSEKAEAVSWQRSSRTVQGYVDCLSSLLSLAMRDWGWIVANPAEQIKKIKFNNERTRFLSHCGHIWPNEDKPRLWDSLSKEEKVEAAKKFPRAYELPRLMQALQAQAKENSGINYQPIWTYYLCKIQLSTGLRLGEATHMVWEENDLINHPIVIVDLANERLILKSTKHDSRPRSKPISGECLEIIKSLYAGRRHDTPLVFPRSDGKKPLDFRKRIRRAIAEAGLCDFRWHDLRHTTASYLAMMGANMPELMFALHQRQIQSTQRYTHMSEGHMRALLGNFTHAILDFSQSPDRVQTD